MDDILYRKIHINNLKIDKEARTVQASFSSEEPYERHFGIEVLSHCKNAIDMTRAKDDLPLLFSHNPDEPIGIVEGIKNDGKTLRGVLRFGNSQKSNELWQDVKSGILKSLSVGYKVLDMVKTGMTDNIETFTVTRWLPMEVSLVTIAADPTIGIGRSYENNFGDNIMDTSTEKLTRSQRKALNINDENSTPSDELGRVQEITAIGSAMNEPDLAKRFIASGESVENFREMLLDTMDSNNSNHGALTESSSSDLGLTKNEVKQFSFMNCVRAQIDPKYQKEAGFEMEVSRAMERKYGKTAQGFLIPDEVLNRALNVGTSTAGGNLVETSLLSGSFIDLLRNRLQVLNLGATVLTGLQGNVAIPRQTSSSTAYWVAEGVAPTISQQSFDQISLTPNTVGAYTDYTRKMMLQSNPDIENLVKRDLASTLAIEIDRVAINGSGTGAEPTGIMNTSGIGSVVGGANGATPTHDHIVSLLAAIESGNVDEGLAFLTNSKVKKKLLLTEKFSGTNGASIWENGSELGSGILAGTRAAISNSVPSDLTKGTSTGVASAIIAGRFSDLILGMWSGLDLTVDPYTFSSTGNVRIVVMQDVDVAVRHVESFAAMLDALTA